MIYKITGNNNNFTYYEVESITDDWRESEQLVKNGEFIIFTDDLDYAMEMLGIKEMSFFDPNE